MRDGELYEVTPAQITVRDFGLGERAAISVVIEHPAWTLLLDDYRPYLFSVSQGITVMCSPLLAVTLYHEGVVSEEQLLAMLGRLEAIRTVSPGPFHHLEARSRVGRPGSARDARGDADAPSTAHVTHHTAAGFAC